MTFIGGAIAYPRNEHMALHAVIERLPQRWHAGMAARGCWQVFAMSIVGGWLAWEMMLSRWDERTPYRSGGLCDDGGWAQPQADRFCDFAGRAFSRRDAAGDRGLDVHHVGYFRIEGR
jgi:Tripartite ATP-independent periplasmic transporters, DctQ component